MRNGIFAVGAVFGLGLAAYLSSAGGVSSVSQPAAATQTAGATTYYVATTGNDGNSCLAVGQECATIQGAVAKVPKRVRHPVTVSIGVGNFAAGVPITGFQFDAAVASVGAYLSIAGTWGSPTLTSGPNPFTPSSIANGSCATWGTVTKTGAGWTPHELRGKWLVKTVTATRYYLIADNTEDVITIVGAAPVPSASGTVYIREPLTVINSITGAALGTTYGAGAANSQGFILGGNESIAGNIWGDIVFSALRFSVNGYPFTVGPDESLNVLNCWFDTALVSKYVAVGSAPRTSFSLQGNVFQLGAGSSAVSANGEDVRIRSQQNLYLSGTRAFATPGGVRLDSSGDEFSTATDVLRGGSSGIVYFECGHILSPIGLQFSSGVGERSMAFGLGSTSAHLYKMAFTSSDTCINVRGPRSVSLEGVTGTCTTAAISASDGAQVYVDSTTTITGGAEISVDGAASTLATMRAASPKYLTNATTGTRVWGN